MNAFNPEIHHRRSIRLKSHDYAGGGLYFVTICAHRDAGQIFKHPGVKEMVGRVWEEGTHEGCPYVGAGLVPALFKNGTHEGCEEEGTHEGCEEEGTHEGCEEEGTHEGCQDVVMPDHFHALVGMRGGAPIWAM